MLRRRKITVLLLSFMMVFTSLFGTGAFVYADTEETEEPVVLEVENEEEPQEEVLEEAITEETPSMEDEGIVMQEVPVEEALDEAPVEEVPAAEATEEVAPEVAFDQKMTVDGVEINVTADPGVFPEGAMLKVETLSKREEAKVAEAIDEVSEEVEVAAQYTFDITIVDQEGNEIQPDTSKGNVNVTFKTEEVADENLQAEVFHIDEDGNAEALNVETEGDVAEVAVDGFSPYTLRFTFYNEQTHDQSVYELRVGTSINANTIASAVGLSSHGAVVAASSNTDNVSVTHSGDNFFITAEAGWNGSSNFGLELRFADGHQDNIRIRCHAHNWDFTASGATATLKCVPGENDSCYYKSTYTKTIVAGNATYNGAQHGAHLEGDMGDIDVHIGDIRYASGHNNTSGGSTTAPTNAGDYTAYVTITADQVGGNVSRTIYTNFTISKASINLGDATARILTYNGNDQGLYNLASAQSATTSQTFDVYYRYADSSSWHANHVLTGKNAASYTIKYKVFGDANHYDSAEKTVVCTIGTRPVYFNGLTAQNRIYNQRTNATINYSGLNVYEVVSGEALTVTVTGTFNNKNAGEDKTVTFSNLQLHAANTATDINNYHINTTLSQTSTKATIFKKEMRIDWQNAMDFQYNGQNQAPTPVKKPGNATRDDDYLVYAGDEVNIGVTDSSWKKEVGNNYEAYVTILGGADANNYHLSDSYSTVGAKFNIVPRKIDVHWSNTTQEYDDRVLAPTVTITDSIALGEGVGVALVTPSDAREAGTYSDAAQLTGDKRSNFVINPYTLTSTFVITKAPLKVSASGWLYYGDTIDLVSDEQYEYVSGLKGDDTLAVLKHTGDFRTDYGSKYDLVDPITDEDHTYTLLPVFENADNYEVINVDGELTVYPKPVVLEWTHTHIGESEDAVADSEYVYDGKTHYYSAKVSEGSYVRVHGRIIDDEIQVTLQDEFERDANVKTNTTKYVAKAMSLSDPNYSLRYKNGTAVETKTINFKINQRPIELSWTPESFMYNADVQIPELTIENLQFNDEEVQDEPFTIQRATVENSEVYNPARKDMSIEVGEYTVSAVNEESGYLVDENYTLVGGVNTSFDYEIEKAPLNVMAKGWITYGEIAEESVRKMSDDTDGADLSYSYMDGEEEVVGFLGEDTEEAEIRIDEMDGLTFASDYEQFNDVTAAGNDYHIVIADGMTAHNYELTFVDDDLTVYPLTAVVAWEDEEGNALTGEDIPEYIYDGAEHGVVAVVANAVNGDVVKGSEYEGNAMVDANAKAGEETPEVAEKYTAVVKGLDNINYTLLVDPKNDPETMVDGREWSFKINPRIVEISGWEFGETIYNGKEQTNHYIFANLVEGDEDTIVAENTAKNVGDYTAVITGVEDKNYTLVGAVEESLSAEWTIKPLPVRLTWSNSKLTYNGKNQKVTATVSNLCEGDKIVLTYEGNIAKDAGTYTAKVTGLDNENYTLEGGSKLSNKWVINPAPLTITAKNKTIVYGDKPANNGVKYTGFKGSDTASVLTGKLTYTYNYARYGKPGSYTITPAGVSAKNYKITFAKGTLKVNNKVTNMLAKATASGNTAAKISWGKVTGAKSYEIWIAKCNDSNRDYELKKVATVTGATSYTVKGLAANTPYKFRVIANTETGQVKSYLSHFATSNLSENRTNPKTITLNKTEVSLKQGKTTKIKGTVTGVVSGKKLMEHEVTLRFATSNKKVATVDANGKITAVGKGWCRIYVVAENGLWQIVEVTVR